MAVCVGCGLQVVGGLLTVDPADNSITCSSNGLCGSALNNAGQDFVPTLESTGSISYTDLATAGPTVTLTTGPQVLVYFQGTLGVTSGGPAFMSVAISGATTRAASDEYALENPDTVFAFTSSYSVLLAGLTPGVNTFQAKYRSASTGSVFFSRRRLIVVP